MEYLDSGHLILEIQKHPCLYDMTCPHFKNRPMKMDAWLSVSRVLVGENWDDMEPIERRKVVKELQKRWKSLRDSYAKVLKASEGKDGDNSKSRKPYLYHKQMSFLQSVFQQRDASEHAHSVKLSHHTVDFDKMADRIEAGSPLATSPLVKDSERMMKREFDHRKQDDAFIPKSEIGRQMFLDPDEMFLLSQVGQIKKLSPADKLDFQVRFLQLLQSYTVRPSSSLVAISPDSRRTCLSRAHHTTKPTKSVGYSLRPDYTL